MNESMTEVEFILRERGIKQTWLARRLGLPKTTLWFLIHKGQKPSYYHVMRIAELLAIPPGGLIDEDGQWRRVAKVGR